MNKRFLTAFLAILMIFSVAAVPAAAEGCAVCAEYRLGANGVSKDVLSESVPSDSKPQHVPTVTAASNDVVFLGWSLTDPATLKPGETPVLVDPTANRISKDTVFYAVYGPFHKHYVIGYPNGNFGPSDFITRGSVATIIARAGLPGFEEGAAYGTGGFTDVRGHWAQSAIAYCALHGVFKGYNDGMFKPDQPITRQEYIAVVVRLAKETGKLPADLLPPAPFDDNADIADWAVEEVTLARQADWISGYDDGTIRPLNNIRRDEAVKIFNGYLGRKVDADGLSDLTKYVHTGTASSIKETTTEYMTWPDVPEDHWAYYEIIEAANDHSYGLTGEKEDQLPEHWKACWIDKRWRYTDDANDDGPLGGTGSIVQPGEK